MGAHRLDGLKARRALQAWSVTELARQATVSDQTVTILENGGVCGPAETQRILDALCGGAQALTSETAANPCVVTKTAHGFQTGDTITISGSTGTTPTINATYAVTRLNSSTFSIPEDTSGGSAGSGGTATPTAASLNIARL